MQCHPEYNNECPWFEHTETGLTSNGRQHCPYANPDASEQQLVRRLQRLLPDATPRVSKADWQCTQCESSYYGERYCLNLSYQRLQPVKMGDIMRMLKCFSPPTHWVFISPLT
ncbi:putative zinc ribbon protein [Klebsiella quasipneumoniae]